MISKAATSIASTTIASSSLASKKKVATKLPSSSKLSSKPIVVVVVKSSADHQESNDQNERTVSSKKSRRNALFAFTAGVGATVAKSASAADFGLWNGLLGGEEEKRDISQNERVKALGKLTVDNLPDLVVKPLDRLEGAQRTSGANKSKAQIEYGQYIAPIIEKYIDLDFGDYVRLMFADAGTHSVVGKKYGLNGSIRFELDRPQNKGLKKVMNSIERIKKEVDARTTQPVSYADLIALVPHFAARIKFKRDYLAAGGDAENYEFLYIGTNPFLGAKIRIGRKDATEADPDGLIPNFDTATSTELLQWFKRMGRGPNELAAFAPYLFEDPQKGIDIVSQDDTCRRVLEFAGTQNITGAKVPAPSVTIIKNLKQVTDNAIPGGAAEVAPAVFDPSYVDYAFISGGGEIPRVGAYPARPHAAEEGGSIFALRLRGEDGSASSLGSGRGADV